MKIMEIIVCEVGSRGQVLGCVNIWVGGLSHSNGSLAPLILL